MFRRTPLTLNASQTNSSVFSEIAANQINNVGTTPLTILQTQNGSPSEPNAILPI
jgi:hypothetical protein